MKKAVFMLVDFRHPSGVPLGEGEVAQVDEDVAEEWEECGVARILGKPGSCRFCGCTYDNACVSVDGEPCSWAEADICSSCIHKKNEPRRGGRGSIEKHGDQSGSALNSMLER